MIKFNKFFQFFCFAIVGVINTVFSLIIYYVLVNVFHINYLISSATAYFLGIFLGFLLNSLFVFKKRIKMKYGIKYFTVYLSSLMINLGLLYLFVDKVKLEKFISQIITTSIVLTYNYFLSKYWSYK